MAAREWRSEWPTMRPRAGSKAMASPSSSRAGLRRSERGPGRSDTEIFEKAFGRLGRDDDLPFGKLEHHGKTRVHGERSVAAQATVAEESGDREEAAVAE